ncbi:Uncharacterised protein [Vibrio cholerae]|nr:Uncharacterised protein [Vibrio cholerae]CSI59205.1 Uncharacterised protein [Vibrio cholerae]CSI88139.1 Uncharacterised protein [Vibrio cholerae]
MAYLFPSNVTTIKSATSFSSILPSPLSSFSCATIGVTITWLELGWKALPCQDHLSFILSAELSPS